MGDLQFCCRQPNGVVAEDHPPLLSSSSSSNPPDTSSIGDDNWVIAEQTTQEIVCCVQPTLVSEQKRKDVVEYVQRLITCCLGLEVISYGSVPLRTYLPDGDIDLTALGSANVGDALARVVLAILQGEERNENAEYEVKDTQFIDAEVKLVKCLVENIVVDISFNQLGGLSTLCFLEQVDRLVGKNHLFKRSIILIKAWCYYESRILGAHHGLISTYALETLVLYIFHMFHSSLNGPLAVLHKFLDYFSKFDWENYCISLNGPVCISSLPDIIVDLPENCRDDFMMSEEFLRNCTDMFSVPSRGLETNLRVFTQKHLNIIDPLKENNNLGRSVNRGSFYRIRSAFKYGARKLGRILLLPSERVADEIKKFFANTLERHGSKSDPNLHNYSLSYGLEESGALSSSFHSETFSEDEMCLKLSNMGNLADGFSVSEYPSAGDLNSRISNDTSDCSPMGSDFFSSFSGHYYHAPNFYFSGSFRENGNITNNYECLSSSSSAISSPDSKISESFSLDFSERSLDGITGDSETLSPLLDLTGDYNNHIRSLLYGLCCHGCLSSPVLPISSKPTSQSPNKKPWETVRRFVPLKRNSCSETNPNGMVLGRPFYPTRNLKSSGFHSSWQEKPKARGTGTYFPTTNVSYWRERPAQGKGRNQVEANHGQFQGHFLNNGFAPPLPERISCEEGYKKCQHLKTGVRGRGKSGLSHRSPNSTFGNSQGNGFSISSQKLEFGSCGHLEGVSQLARGTYRAWVSTSSLASLEVQSLKPPSVNSQERVIEKTIHFKNEQDFPSLSF